MGVVGISEPKGVNPGWLLQKDRKKGRLEVTSRNDNKAFGKGLAEATHGFSTAFRKQTNYLLWVKAAKVSAADLIFNNADRWRTGLASWLAPMGVCVYV